MKKKIKRSHKWELIEIAVIAITLVAATAVIYFGKQ